MDGVRVLVFNGETDAVISSIKTQEWLDQLGFPVEQPWRQWTFPGTAIVAGNVVQYGGNVTTFVTVRGAGHMIPAHKPYSAYLMMKTWLESGSWPALPRAEPPSGALSGSVRFLAHSDADVGVEAPASGAARATLFVTAAATAALAIVALR